MNRTPETLSAEYVRRQRRVALLHQWVALTAMIVFIILAAYLDAYFPSVLMLCLAMIMLVAALVSMSRLANLREHQNLYALFERDQKKDSEAQPRAGIRQPADGLPKPSM